MTLKDSKLDHVGDVTGMIDKHTSRKFINKFSKDTKMLEYDDCYEMYDPKEVLDEEYLEFLQKMDAEDRLDEGEEQFLEVKYER